MSNIPPAALALGQCVRVVLSERNRTPRAGTIRSVNWHFRDRRHYYHIDVGGKTVSKRYYEDDLEPAGQPVTASKAFGRTALTGRLTVKSAPPSGWLPALMKPPCRRAFSQAMARPRPLPSERARAVSAL